MPVSIDFEPIGRRGECPDGGTLLDCARLLGVGLANLCGGSGTCGRCVVQVTRGPVSEPTSREARLLKPEQLDQGYRLACLTRPLGNCTVRVPPESMTTPQRTQVEGETLAVEPEPVVSAFTITSPPASISDLRADAQRLVDALVQQQSVVVEAVDLAVLQGISPVLRHGQSSSEGTWRARAAVRGGEVVAMLPGEDPTLGMAVDVGTTKIAVYLLDLVSGRTLASEGMMNPQIAFGEDVIARMAHANKGPEQALQMQTLLVEALNAGARRLCDRVGVSPAEILEMVVVANTAIHHLLLRLPVQQLVLAPYTPAVSCALDVKARDLGLGISPGGHVFLLPNIAGYVGADHVAMLLACGMDKVEGNVLALDIGTNTEVCLASRGRLVSTSCASGPAFEGAHIKHGMRAANGAIERVRLVNGEVEFQTIGDAPPIGLCGSAALDAMAELHAAGILDTRGRMGTHPRVSGEGAQREFLLARAGLSGDGGKDVTFTQRDVHELMLAKGAMRTGIEVLLEVQGLGAEDIDQVILAGAFGTYIDVANAMAVGMLPKVPLDRVSQVGNAAGMGAKMALVSRSKRNEAVSLAQRVDYVELATHPGFSRIFAQAMYLGRRPGPSRDGPR